MGYLIQSESGTVLVQRRGTPLLLGGPETHNFPVFMVTPEFI